MRKFIFAFITIMILLELTGCGAKGVSEKQLCSDIVSREEVKNCYRSKYVSDTEYEISECTVTREQYNPEKKEDIVFCDVTVTDGYFEVKFPVELLYNYYDKGGWILDEFSMGEMFITAVGAPDAQLVYNSLIQHIEYDGCDYIYEDDDGEFIGGKLTVVNSELYDYGKHLCKKIDEEIAWLKKNGADGSDVGIKEYIKSLEKSKEEKKTFISENGLQGARINCQYISDVLEVNGYYEMIFDRTENEWVFEYIETYDLHLAQDFNVTDYKADYSEAIGKYEYQKNIYGIVGSTLVINSIGDKSLNLNINHQLPYLAFGSRYDEELTPVYEMAIENGRNITVEFNELSGKFHIWNTSSGSKGYLTYDPKSNCWVDEFDYKFYKQD